LLVCSTGHASGDSAVQAGCLGCLLLQILRTARQAR
jgi:hypothetical protein